MKKRQQRWRKILIGKGGWCSRNEKEKVLELIKVKKPRFSYLEPLKVIFSSSFWLDPKGPKNQDAKKLLPAKPNAGPLLRLATVPS